MLNAYLDYAATAPLRPCLHEVGDWKNPSSLHIPGREAKLIIEEAEKRTLEYLNGVQSDSIVFTSGGTESNNIILQSYAKCCYKTKPHIITSVIEHPSVLKTLKYCVQKNWCDVTFVNVDSNGLVSIDDVKNAVTNNTVLISIMYVNNEIGTIQNIHEIGEIAKEYGIAFHTDATQAFLHLPIDVVADNIDLVTFSGHKFGALKGIGGFYVSHKEKPLIQPIMMGGSQGDGLRPGTENVQGIASVWECLIEDAIDTDKLKEISEKFYEALGTLPNVTFNSHPSYSYAGIINFCLHGYNAETVVLLMSKLHRIYMSTGSACHEGSIAPSHVLKAVGMSDKNASSSIRISFDDSILSYVPGQFINALKDVMSILDMGGKQ